MNNFLRKSLSLKDCLGLDPVDRKYWADNVAITAGAGTSVATDDIGGVHFQRVKLIEGADGVNDGDISSSNGLPVQLLASTAAIGKLAANSGVDIGDVDVTSLPASVVAGKASLSQTLDMITRATFTITLASLANAAARQSTLISNSSNYPAALIFLKITSGASGPTAGTVYEVYLLRSDGTTADDGAGASDAAITIENAPLLGTIVVTNSTAKAFYGVFDTAPLGPLGDTWGIAVKNSTGQALSTTEGDHVKGYMYYVPVNT